MPTQTYTGNLRNIGLAALTGVELALRVRPEVECFGPNGLVSKVPKPIALGSAGEISVALIPSGDLTPAQGGETGVDYIIELARFEDAIDGSRVLKAVDFWRFTAVAGGGDIGEMAGGSLLAVWVGPPWPPLPSPKGFYIDKTPPNAYGIRS
ncbi:hypothetical protein [Microbacterium sp. MMO-56]|uniref:hypothetical protein n=1 Tax=Microbacterium sp. MMO-56 TaxID=3081281 RepID=UPI00301653B4